MENNQLVTDLFFWITFGEIAALSCFVPTNDVPFRVIASIRQLKLNEMK